MNKIKKKKEEERKKERKIHNSNITEHKTLNETFLGGYNTSIANCNCTIKITNI